MRATASPRLMDGDMRSQRSEAVTLGHPGRRRRLDRGRTWGLSALLPSPITRTQSHQPLSVSGATAAPA